MAKCGIHAPLAMKASATASCLASSRVMSRTSTLVSTARMALLDVHPDSVPQLFEASPFWRLREQHPMNVQRRIAACLADDDAVAILIPLEHRARPDAQPQGRPLFVSGHSS